MNNFLQTFLQTEFIQSNTLNFIIVLACLVWIILKLDIGSKLEDAKNLVKSYVNEAENEKLNAEKSLAEINLKVQKLPEEIKEIERSVKNSIDSLASKSKKDIEEKIRDIDNNVSRIMDLETKKFKSKLTSILSEASVNLAKDNALKQLENNREMHDKYIYEAIDEIDGMNL